MSVTGGTAEGFLEQHSINLSLLQVHKDIRTRRGAAAISVGHEPRDEKSGSPASRQCAMWGCGPLRAQGEVES